MEMATVKSELSLGRRHIGAVDAGEAAPAKVVKRRRRDTSAVALNQPEQSSQVAQPASATTAAATTVKRSSRFRGVSRHRWTGRFEAHLWDKGSWNPTQRKKGKQVYLGAYDEEESAARAYDLAAIKYWGTSTFTNFPVSDYEKEIMIMNTVTKEEYLSSLRRRSSGFSRGVSRYRGVARHHQNGRWEARIGRVFGNKYLYLGTYGTQEEAAHAYDIAAIEYRGINAVTNFDLSRYIRWLKPAQDPQQQQQQQQQQPSNNVESQAMTPASISIPREEQIFHANAFPVNHEHPKTPVSPFAKSSSSPTALGLLFRSSVFRELVGRNLNAAEDESEKSDHTENLAQIGGSLYEEMGNIPFMCSSSGDVLPDLEAQECALPVYNRTGQSLWNRTLNMSPSITNLNNL